MSLCNIWADKQSALVAVDTASLSWPERKPGHMSKLLVISHASTVLAFRGERMMFTLLFLQVTHLANSFDEVVDILPDRLKHLSATAEALPDGSTPDCTIELYAIGWSDRLERMSVMRFLYVKGSEVEMDDLSDSSVVLSPCASQEETEFGYLLPTREDIDFVAEVKAFMARQAEFGRQTHADVAFGGNLILATVHKGRTTVEDLGPIE